MALTTRKRIGEYLLDAGLVTKEQLQLAEREVRRTGELFGEVLVRLAFITADDLTMALAQQAGIQLVDLDTYPVDYALLQTIPEAFVRKHNLVPIKQEGFTLTAASSSLANLAAVDELQRLTNLFVTVVAAKQSQVSALIDRVYSKPKLGPSPAAAPTAAGREASVRPEVEGADQSSVVRLVEELFQKAAREGATDIHIEPHENAVVTRFRYDGLLQRGPVLPRALVSAIVTRIKILANMNISESRLPQDGRILHQEEGKRFDLRVSTFPTIHGENVAIRVLDKSRTFGLEMLGFSPDQMATFRRLIVRPYGLVLVTGPTGSGKTTTLYSALLEINSVDKNIMTLEDPVEYELPQIRQSQINVRSGFTFATGLRSILRHDPDVILVGEMRDLETVETTIRSALTGHLVFSTLHTNDAVGTVPRLIEMGVEPYLIASSLLAVIAQRLARVICSNCKVEATPAEAGLERLGDVAKIVPTAFIGKGCTLCNSTGYRGRTGVFELLEITPRIIELITQRADPEALRKQALEEGIRPMFEDGLQKVAAGITTVDEVIRVLHSVE